jgi:hypothetical protein
MLYVADLRNRVVKLNPSSDTIEKTWPVRVGRASGGANLTFGGRFLFVTDPEPALLYAIDTESGGIETFPAGRGTDPDVAARRSGVGPCATKLGTTAFATFPLCVGELLARCRAGADRPSPR